MPHVEHMRTYGKDIGNNKKIYKGMFPSFLGWFFLQCLVLMKEFRTSGPFFGFSAKNCIYGLIPSSRISHLGPYEDFTKHLITFYRIHIDFRRLCYPYKALKLPSKNLPQVPSNIPQILSKNTPTYPPTC